MFRIIFLILSTTVCLAQSSIVAGGNLVETFGETFGETVPSMQQDIYLEQVSLSIPKFEVSVEEPKKEIKDKPKTFLEKLILIFKKLLKWKK